MEFVEEVVGSEDAVGLVLDGEIGDELRLGSGLEVCSGSGSRVDWGDETVMDSEGELDRVPETGPDFGSNVKSK